MITVPDRVPISAVIAGVRFNALRGTPFETPGAKLYLFKEGTTAQRALVPIEFDPAKPAGQVLRGWRVNPRRFDRFGDPFLQINVARSATYTAAQLGLVRGFAVIERGQLSGVIHRCDPAGVAALSSEPTWRFTSTGRTTQLHELSTSQIEFEDSVDDFLLEDGSGSIELEVA